MFRIAWNRADVNILAIFELLLPPSEKKTTYEFRVLHSILGDFWRALGYFLSCAPLKLVEAPPPPHVRLKPGLEGRAGEGA